MFIGIIFYPSYVNKAIIIEEPVITEEPVTIEEPIIIKEPIIIEEPMIRQEIMPSRGEEIHSYVATAYTHTGYNTATGVYPKEKHTIAVDPSIIPLGSIVYISSDFPDITGYYKAEDTGSVIKGKKIDIFMDNHSACLQFGKRNVFVTVVNEGEEEDY